MTSLVRARARAPAVRVVARRPPWPSRDHRIKAATDARDAAWFAVSEARGLAFDHDHIVTTALERLKGKVRYQPIDFELLPPEFTLSQLQRLYETIGQGQLTQALGRAEPVLSPATPGRIAQLLSELAPVVMTGRGPTAEQRELSELPFRRRR